MNRDRGTIKWNAMMLPEHVKMLREWQVEDKIEQRPELNEWALQEIAELLQNAYTHHLYIELDVWSKTRLVKKRGYITAYNATIACIKLNEETVNCDTICGAQLLD